MPLEIKVPEVGESISEVQIGAWRKAEGQRAEKDENLVELETDKATMELAAPAAGTLYNVLKRQGDRAVVGEVIGYLLELGETADAAEGKAAKRRASGKSRELTPPVVKSETEESIAKTDAAASQLETAEEKNRESRRPAAEMPAVAPAVRRELRKHGLRSEDVPATGPGGRLVLADVKRHLEETRHHEKLHQPSEAASGDRGKALPAAATTAEHEETPAVAVEVQSTPLPRAGSTVAPPARVEEAVPMSLLRRRIAERLVEARQTAALLTTFNEIDMSALTALRHRHRDAFQEKYGIKLGMMSFFVKASIDALKLVPQVNAEIRGHDIVYRNYADIGIAVGGGKGLVVPVLRDAERMSFAEIERAIADFAQRAGQNQLKPAELSGGTFTISNGGIYGSLLSTPIVNPPQSGILGLHAIQDRPVARDGQVVIRPMMYVALTYDHRLIDGREAVVFLRRVKETIEEPSRLLLEI